MVYRQERVSFSDVTTPADVWLKMQKERPRDRRRVDSFEDALSYTQLPEDWTNENEIQKELEIVRANVQKKEIREKLERLLSDRNKNSHYVADEDSNAEISKSMGRVECTPLDKNSVPTSPWRESAGFEPRRANTDRPLFGRFTSMMSSTDVNTPRRTRLTDDASGRNKFFSALLKPFQGRKRNTDKGDEQKAHRTGSLSGSSLYERRTSLERDLRKHRTATQEPADVKPRSRGGQGQRGDFKRTQVSNAYVAKETSFRSSRRMRLFR
mmetsp:Transcript_10569/g.32345  ORF Transcript_10569/g.32345 Transcript_10569/m.32345 type:complete len:268 (-) Transcript_10569:2632-3435(-)